MKNIGTSNKKRKQEFINVLSQKKKELISYLEEYNKKLEEINEALKSRLNNYNKSVLNAVNFVDEVVDQMDDWYENRTDAWREGEDSKEFLMWMHDWKHCHLPEIEIDYPEGLTEADFEFGADENLGKVSDNLITEPAEPRKTDSYPKNV